MTATASAAVPFPARSVAVTTSHCSPTGRSRFAVHAQLPSKAAVVPQATIRAASAARSDRAVTSTWAPGSALPASRGLATRRVSPAVGAVSTGRSGGTVSTTSSTARPGVRFPARSAAVGVSRCRPSARFSTGRQDQPPSARTPVLHRSAP